MAQTNINIRMDSQLKSQFETFCTNVGLTMSAAFNIYAKTTVRLQKIPFEITAETDPFYSESNIKLVNRSLLKAIDQDGGQGE
jgi:DNA-damage-inducible protein J